MITREYNPLSIEELGRNAARALMDYPAVGLPPSPAFKGGGVYTLYYVGRFPAYIVIDDETPLYVGQALLTKTKRKPLHQRLSEHARSIENVDNLNLADFYCRWLVLDSVWIEMTERVLITKYRPIWNAVVTGFGNHNQGRTRYTQERSRWDTVHPGRSWATNQRDNRDSVASILQEI